MVDKITDSINLINDKKIKLNEKKQLLFSQTLFNGKHWE